MNSHLPPLAIYVHFPWCIRKCPYCDFNSHALSGELPEVEYVAQLCADIQHEAPLWSQRQVQTVFMGGGTPSLFSPASIETVLEKLRATLFFSHDVEITLEANPGTAEAARFSGFRAAGINRISLGVQSFDDVALQGLGRIHDGNAARRAIDFAQAAGFSHINVDLMHGLPEQTPAGALQDIDIAIAAGVQHVSWYQLTIEPNTAFFTAPPRLPDEDQLEDIEANGFALLQARGFARYEVSAWCKGDHAARHNLNYWRFGDYVGIGAGAHGKQSEWRDGALHIQRYQKSRAPRDYLVDCGRKGVQQVATHDLPFEFLLNTLRLADGVSEGLFTAHTGLPLDALQPMLTRLRRDGLIQEHRLAATTEGWRYLDSLLEAFIPPTDAERAKRSISADRIDIDTPVHEVRNLVPERDTTPLETSTRPLRWS